jgi:hypothetical protein
VTDFSGTGGRWPAYATLRRGRTYVDEKTRTSDEVLAMGDVGSFCT